MYRVGIMRRRATDEAILIEEENLRSLLTMVCAVKNDEAVRTGEYTIQLNAQVRHFFQSSTPVGGDSLLASERPGDIPPSRPR